MTRLLLASLLTVLTANATTADPAEERLKRAFKQFPAADLNNDGTLTQKELQSFHRESARKMRKPKVYSTIFKPSADELKQAFEGNKGKGALKSPKGNGLRILITGHSWVAPANKTLPAIAAAAGLDGHRQRAHISGGATGAANAIWLKEFGKFEKQPAKPIIIPALATGEWDVLAWGSYYADETVYFSQWMDVALHHNPGMTFFIQDGWPRYTPALHQAKKEESLKKIEAEMNRMEKEYFTPAHVALNKSHRGKIQFIPAGRAVVELIRRYHAGALPGFDCVSENMGGTRGIYRDGGHLSRTSGAEHLLGYVYYASLYRRSPALINSKAPKNIPDEIDKQLREIAWQAAVESPLNGIRDKDRNGKAD
ncbi:MAG: EF-hand domain-containing protein [Limisphaerales bacterium]